MVTFIILLNVKSSRITAIAEQLADMPEISEVYSVTGNYDLVVIVRTHSNDEVAELVTVVCDELRRVASDPMDDGEIARSRAQIKAGVLMSLESTSSRAERVARHLQVYDRIIPVDEIARRIDAVTAEDVRRVAERLLTSAPTLTALGPVDGLQDYDTVKALLAS